MSQKYFQFLSLFIIIVPVPIYSLEKADQVLVIKSQQILLLKSGDHVLRKYKVVFGGNPSGHKEKQGDQRTPEGKYILDYKNSNSGYYKSIHISYPNKEDKRKANETGVDPGGQIMIHGQKNGYAWMAVVMQLFNWTNGCIAVTNHEMDEIWNLVEVGTPIEIRP